MTTSDNEAVADHVNQARDFLGRSRQYLAAGDLHQASEKGWGAASHMAKAVAASQGWQYATHAEFNVVLNLAGQIADSSEKHHQIRRFGAVAARLHGNYYSRKRHLDSALIGADLEDVAALLDLLEPLTRKGDRRG